MSKIFSKSALTAQRNKIVREGHVSGLTDSDENQLAAIDQALWTYDKLAALCSAISIDPPSVEWYSPDWAIDLAREVMGQIDLDPASNEIAQKRVQAGAYYTQAENGLVKRWRGWIFCNPPYGKKYPLFMDRAIALYEAGEIEGAVFLLNRSGAKVYREKAAKFTAIAQVYRRISFLSPDGIPQKSPTKYNDFLYLGPDSKRFAEVMRREGPGQSDVIFNINPQKRKELVV